MIQTFNCGIGFCIIVNKNKIEKIRKFFPKKFKPYEIGFISKDLKKVNILRSPW